MTGRSKFRWRESRLWRRSRWIGLAAALPVIWACNDRRLEAPVTKPEQTSVNRFQETLNREIDIVFVIDNSMSMTPLQTKLLANFPVFMQVLQMLPGGLPSVHIGVVSSSMGAGGYAPPGCPSGGDGGRFQATARAANCVATGSGLMAGQNYISNANGVANYMGQIENVFTCIAALGDTGCGFEHQFGSVIRALGADGGGVPAENVGFLRDNAFLSIIFITNEDDCSVPPDSGLFDPNQRYVADQFGPLSSFRCNEYGHLCNGTAPSRTAAATYTGCTSAEGAGLLIPVADVVSQIRGLKPDPNKILVAAIAGPATPYIVDLVTPMNNDTAMWPAIRHSCMQTSGEYADPGVRLTEFVTQMNGVYLPICADSFAPALMQIAMEIGKVLGPKCVRGVLADKDPAQAGVQPDCTVVDHTFDTSGNSVDTTVPACADTNNNPPCWQLNDDPMCNSTAQNPAKVLSIMRPQGQMLPNDLNNTVSCALCIPGVDDPRCQ